VRLEGKIDRVDILDDFYAVSIVDYKLSRDAFVLANVYHKLSLQLLTYLVVLKEAGDVLMNQQLTPAGAFYVKLLRGLVNVRHPSQIDEQGPIELRVKPRGVLRNDYFNYFDSQSTTTASDVYQVPRNKEGEFINRNWTDAATRDEFNALLKSAKLAIAALVDDILDGRIDANPYLQNGYTPCTYCDYKSVCRFDRAVNCYNKLEKLRRDKALDKIVAEVNGA
jgi:ATP-dependent helicase/nuclease subunit B